MLYTYIGGHYITWKQKSSTWGSSPSFLPLIAIVLSFATRNTIVSLVVACIVGTLLVRSGAFRASRPLLKNKPWYHQFFLGYAAEYIYRYHRCIFPEDRSNPELLSDDSRQEFKPPRRTADGMGSWNLCILQ